MKVVEEPGDSQILKAGQIISARKLREENSSLVRKDLKIVESRDAIPATSEQRIQGIIELHYKQIVGFLLHHSKKQPRSLTLLLLMVKEIV